MSYTIEQHEDTMTLYFYKNGTKKGTIVSSNTGITNMDIYGEEKEYKMLTMDFINIPYNAELLKLSACEEYIVVEGEVKHRNNIIDTLCRENIDLLHSNWDLEFRVFEIEMFLKEQRKISHTSLVPTLDKYLIAKKIILNKKYDGALLTYQLNRYYECDIISKAIHEELLTLMG